MQANHIPGALTFHSHQGTGRFDVWWWLIFWCRESCSDPVLSYGRRREGNHWRLFYKNTRVIPKYFFPNAPFPMTSDWGLGFQHMNILRYPENSHHMYILPSCRKLVNLILLCYMYLLYTGIYQTRVLKNVYSHKDNRKRQPNKENANYVESNLEYSSNLKIWSN